jgi:hypothetical protein
MEFSLRMIVVALLLIVAFVVIIALVTGWGGQSGSLLDSVVEWFQNMFMPKPK